MAINDTAKGLVDLCKLGKFEEAVKEYYADDIVSVEPMGDPATVTGLDAVLGKLEWFHTNVEIHSAEVFGPYINGDEFAVRFLLDSTNKLSGQRSIMDEIGVYTVADGKIVHERFLFHG